MRIDEKIKFTLLELFMAPGDMFPPEKGASKWTLKNCLEVLKNPKDYISNEGDYFSEKDARYLTEISLIDLKEVLEESAKNAEKYLENLSQYDFDASVFCHARLREMEMLNETINRQLDREAPLNLYTGIDRELAQDLIISTIVGKTSLSMGHFLNESKEEVELLLRNIQKRDTTPPEEKTPLGSEDLSPVPTEDQSPFSPEGEHSPRSSTFPAIESKGDQYLIQVTSPDGAFSSPSLA